MTPLLDVRDVSKSFGALKAVDSVSFALSPGEILGIAGPNGSGKSTLFNALTAIPFGPDRGEIFLAGAPLHGLGPHRIARAGLARTFQRETVFATRTVFDNVLLARLHGFSGASSGTDREAAAAALDFCGVAAGEHGRVAGEVPVLTRKKTMIASALAMRPKALLFDEPASGLTRPEVAETERLIRAVRDSGVAVVLIEHVLALLLGVCDRLMVLNEGREIAQGLPGEVVRDERVIASYLGTRGGDG